MSLSISYSWSVEAQKKEVSDFPEIVGNVSIKGAAPVWVFRVVGYYLEHVVIFIFSSVIQFFSSLHMQALSDFPLTSLAAFLFM